MYLTKVEGSCGGKFYGNIEPRPETHTIDAGDSWIDTRTSITVLRIWNPATLSWDAKGTVGGSSDKPNVKIKNPTTNESYATNQNSITLSGEVSSKNDINNMYYMVILNGSSIEVGDITPNMEINYFITNAISIAQAVEIQVIAEDTEGNVGSDTINVVYDIDSPTIEIDTPTTLGTLALGETDKNVTFSGTASDASSGIDRVDFELVGATNYSGTAFGTEAWSFTSDIKNGNTTLTVRAYDLAGHIGVDTLSITKTADGPEITITSPNTGGSIITGNEQVLFAGTITDVDGVDTFSWEMAGATVKSGVFPNNQENWSLLETLENGDTTLTLTAIDVHGAVTAINYNVKYDATYPVVNIVTPTNGLTYDQPDTDDNISLSGTATDATTTIVEVQYEMTGATLKSGTASGTNTWSFSETVNHGDTIIKMIAIDEVGKQGVDYLTVTREVVKPQITITSPSAGGDYLTGLEQVTFAGQITDANGIHEATWKMTGNTNKNGTLTLDGSGNFTLTEAVNSGQTSFEITATDMYGAVSTKYMVITYDRDFPKLKILNPSVTNTYEAASSESSLLVSGTASDNTTSIVEVRYSLSGATNGNGVANGIDNWNFSANINFGTTVITVAAEDENGRIVYNSLTVAKEVVKPEINFTAPSALGYAESVDSNIDIRGNIVDPTGVASINWEMTGDTVKSGSLTASSTFNLLNTLNAGLTTFTLTVTNNIGQSSSASMILAYAANNPTVTIDGYAGASTFILANQDTLNLTGTVTPSVVSSSPVNYVYYELSGATIDSGTCNLALDEWDSPALTINTGITRIVIRAVDNAGKEGETILTVTKQISLPTITSDVPTDEGYFGTKYKDVTFSGTVSDIVDIDRVEYALTGATSKTGTATYNSGDGSWSFDEVLGDGGTTIAKIKAINVDGGEAELNINVFYDNNLPVVEITSPTLTSSYEQSDTVDTITISGNAVPSVNSIASVTYSMMGDTTGSGTATGTDSWSFNATINHGETAVVVTATDTSGKSSSTILNVSRVGVDPEITITTPTTTGSFVTGNASVTVSGQITDANGIATATYELTGTDSDSGTLTLDGNGFYSFDLTLTTSGNSTLTIAAIDPYGFSSNVTMNLTFDNENPEVFIQTPSVGTTYEQSDTVDSVSFSGIATDATTSISQVQWSMTGATTKSGTASGTDTWSFTEDVNHGLTVVTVTATDSTGKTGTDVININRPISYPTITILTPSNTGSWISNVANPSVDLVSFSGLVNDPNGLTSFNWEMTGATTASGSLTPVNGAWDFDQTINEGLSTLTMTAVDPYGYQTQTQLVIRHDVENPVINITSHPSSFNSQGLDINVKGTVNDNLPIQGVEFKLEGATTQDWTAATVSSSPEQILSQQINMVMGPNASGDWFEEAAYNPTVLEDNQTPGLFHMWFMASDAGWANFSIGYAWSDDLINWYDPQRVIQESDFGPLTGGRNRIVGGGISVWQEDDGSFTGMFNGGYVGLATDITGIRCTSPDGKVWSAYSATNFNAGNMGGGRNCNNLGTLIKEGATYKMWADVEQGSWSTDIGYAESTDCITWSNFQRAQRSDQLGGYDSAWIYGPGVIKIGGKYRSFAMIQGSSTNGAMNYCESDDGVNWTNYKVLFDVGLEGTYDTSAIRRCHPILVDGTLHMFYGGTNPDFRILHTTIEMPSNLDWEVVIDSGDSGTGYDVHYTGQPMIIKESETSYKMWYVGSGNTSYPQTYRIIYCDSTDGITWTNYQVVIAANQSGTGLDTAYAHRCYVLFDSTANKYKMWYQAFRGNYWSIIRCDSDDGITWANFASVITGNNDYANVHVYKNADNDWRLWYCVRYGGAGDFYPRTMTSTDGINWTNDTGCVGSSLDGSNNWNGNTGYMYDLRKEGGSYHAIFAASVFGSFDFYHAESTDGITWTNQRKVLNNTGGMTGTDYDSVNSSEPKFIKNADGTSYTCWFRGAPENSTNYNIIRMEYPNGLYMPDTGEYYEVTRGKMVVDYDNPNVANMKNTFAPHVIYDPDADLYKMWRAYSPNGGSSDYGIAYCESKDGENWFNHQIVIPKNSSGTGYDSNDAHSPCVIRESGASYKMWYMGNDSGGSRILYCTSTDGINWSNYQVSLGVNTSGTGYDSQRTAYPFVIKESETDYKLWYNAFDGSAWRIMYAESTDGLTWTNHQLAIDTNASGTGYDSSTSTFSAAVVKDGSKYRITYTGVDGGGNYRVLSAESTDGYTFTNFTLFLGHGLIEGGYADTFAAYSSILDDPNTGKYKVYFQGQNSSPGRICMVEVERIDKEVKFAELVFGNGPEEIQDSKHAQSPCVLKEAADSYRMWYSAEDESAAAGLGRIFHAESTDGITWTKRRMVLDNNQTAYDTYAIREPFVIKESETSYKMWYTSLDGSDLHVMYAESEDGYEWTNIQMVLAPSNAGDFEDYYVGHPSVVKNSETSYQMWYMAYDGSTAWRIGYAESTDGINWSNRQQVIDINQEGTYDTNHITNPFVIKESETSYKMWYGGFDGSKWRMLLATSSDGINWTIPELYMDVGRQGTYDISVIGNMWIVEEGDDYEHYFTGYDAGGIGYILNQNTYQAIRWETGNVELNPAITTLTARVQDIAYNEAQASMVIDAIDPYDIEITSDTTNINLRTELENAGWNGTDIITASFTVKSGVIVGSTDVTLAAIETGDLTNAITTLTVENGAYIVGKGGNGSSGNGGAGGNAILATSLLTINNFGIIGGGGGAGGGPGFSTNNISCAGARSGGGGGAGYIAGSGGASHDNPHWACGYAGYNGNAGSLLTGGAGGAARISGTYQDRRCHNGKAGNGGDLGQPGAGGDYSYYYNNGVGKHSNEWGPARPGGSAGCYVSGISNISWINQGDTRGNVV